MSNFTQGKAAKASRLLAKNLRLSRNGVNGGRGGRGSRGGRGGGRVSLHNRGRMGPKRQRTATASRAVRPDDAPDQGIDNEENEDNENEDSDESDDGGDGQQTASSSPIMSSEAPEGDEYAIHDFLRASGTRAPTNGNQRRTGNASLSPSRAGASRDTTPPTTPLSRAIPLSRKMRNTIVDQEAWWNDESSRGSRKAAEIREAANLPPHGQPCDETRHPSVIEDPESSGNSLCIICQLVMHQCVQLPCTHSGCKHCILGLRNAQSRSKQHCPICVESYHFHTLPHAVRTTDCIINSLPSWCPNGPDRDERKEMTLDPFDVDCRDDALATPGYEPVNSSSNNEGSCTGNKSRVSGVGSKRARHAVGQDGEQLAALEKVSTPPVFHSLQYPGESSISVKRLLCVRCQDRGSVRAIGTSCVCRR